MNNQTRKEESSMNSSGEATIIYENDKASPKNIMMLPRQQIGNSDALFYDDPATVIRRAKEVSKLLADIVTKCKLYVVVNGNKYVFVTGWNIMLSMLGIVAKPIINEGVIRKDEISYRCLVELSSAKSGNVIGSGWGFCSSKEPRRSKDIEHCIQSMAQTRALGKAARLSFAWIMKLAGYEPTPAEEMEGIDASSSNVPINQAMVRAKGDLASSLRASASIG